MLFRKHWTPRHVFNKINLMLYEKCHPKLPWLARTAIEFFDGYLKPTHTGIEFGSGRSTVWFAQRNEHITSIEHNKNRFEFVKRKLAERKIGNVDYVLSPVSKHFYEENYENDYSKVLDKFEHESLDFALIDDIYRSSCALRAISKIKCGGMIILDDVERYIFHPSFSPESINTEIEMSKLWEEFADRIGSWRTFFTSNGVCDIAFFFKPV